MKSIEIAWLVVGGIVSTLIVAFSITILPEIRRYRRMKKM